MSKSLPPVPEVPEAIHFDASDQPLTPEPTQADKKAFIDTIARLEKAASWIEKFQEGFPTFLGQLEERFKRLEAGGGGGGSGGGGWLEFGKSIVDLIKTGFQTASSGGGGGFGAEMESMGREIIKGNLKELIWMTKERAKSLGITEGAGQVIEFKKP